MQEAILSFNHVWRLNGRADGTITLSQVSSVTFRERPVNNIVYWQVIAIEDVAAAGNGCSDQAHQIVDSDCRTQTVHTGATSPTHAVFQLVAG